MGNSDSFAIAHLTTVGTAVAGYIGGLLGDKTKSAEDMKLPESLEFFKDTSMSVSIVMGIFYLLLVILAGTEVVGPVAGDTNYIVFGLLKALGFTAGILVMLQGVRMFLGELVPAFKGISDKVVLGAIPALDVPALFAYAPNSNDRICNSSYRYDSSDVCKFNRILCSSSSINYWSVLHRWCCWYFR